MKKVIGGIQQIGIGIPNVYEAFKWYRQHFSMDISLFDDAATAKLMLPYTGGKPQDRHAVLALNMQGGGGMEIWQYVSRTPQPASFDIQLGDYGIYAAKIKCRDVAALYANFQEKGLDLVGKLSKAPNGEAHFFVNDPYGNLFEVVSAESNHWFSKNKNLSGGSYGCIIGTSDIEAARHLYSDILGYDTVIYDETGVFEDYAALAGGKAKVRRVLLKHSNPRKGPFSQLLGASQMELVQVIDSVERSPKKIYVDRFWGDLGFIHLCFDIQGMDALKAECAEKGFGFTVDSSNTFDMGEAAGRFSYIEDPDGTLIEFVETHKMPILKKIGWYLNLRKRNPEKPLPRWMLKTLAFSRVKD